MKNFQLKGKATCRIAYPQGLFEKRTVKGAEGEPKFDAVLCVPKDDKVKVEQIIEEFNKAFTELQQSGFKGKSPSAINPHNNCFIDGDKYADEQDGREAFRGYYLLKFRSKFRPLIVDMQKRTITNGLYKPNVDVENISDEHLEDGDYVHANVSFWSYNRVAQGIGCNIHALIRVASGEPFGGGVSTNVDDYIKIDGEDYQ